MSRYHDNDNEYRVSHRDPQIERLRAIYGGQGRRSQIKMKMTRADWDVFGMCANFVLWWCIILFMIIDGAMWQGV